MMYTSWDMECNKNFLSFWGIFCPFTSLTTWKIKILKKWKKTLGDIIILLQCTTNNNHMIYSSWDMEHDRQNFLSFWTIFCLFTLLKTGKIKLLKKWKKHLEILSFYTCVPEIKTIWCMVPEIWNVTDKFFLSFLAIFCPFTPLTTWEIKFLKNEKNTWRYHHFTAVYYKQQSYDI